MLKRKQKSAILNLIIEPTGGNNVDKKEQALQRFKEVFNKRAWLNKTKMENQLSEYKPSEVHCIEYIGENQEANVTKMARSLYMTRGAISKITKKLLKKGAIESYQKADNKKEIYFRLTEKGQKTFDIHERLHKEFEARDQAVFNDVTDEQYDVMVRFLDKYNAHLDKEIRKDAGKSQTERE